MSNKNEVIEMTFTQLGEIYKSLPDPDIWKHEIEKKYISNGVDDTTDFYTTVNGEDFSFILRHINEMAVQWVPKQKILISDSDEECFKKNKLIWATHTDGSQWSKDEIDAYNKERGAI